MLTTGDHPSQAAPQRLPSPIGPSCRPRGRRQPRHVRARRTVTTACRRPAAKPSTAAVARATTSRATTTRPTGRRSPSPAGRPRATCPMSTPTSGRRRPTVTMSARRRRSTATAETLSLPSPGRAPLSFVPPPSPACCTSRDHDPLMKKDRSGWLDERFCKIMLAAGSRSAPPRRANTEISPIGVAVSQGALPVPRLD